VLLNIVNCLRKSKTLVKIAIITLTTPDYAPVPFLFNKWNLQSVTARPLPIKVTAATITGAILTISPSPA